MGWNWYYQRTIVRFWYFIYNHTIRHYLVWLDKVTKWSSLPQSNLSEEIEFIVEPKLSDSSDCICCPEKHINGYRFTPNLNAVYDCITSKMRIGDQYKKRKFKIIVEEYVEETKLVGGL